MSGANMSDVLGEVFNTNKTASAEDLEKTAQREFFLGLCDEQGIKIAELSDSQLETLWKAAMDMRSKEAADANPFPPKKGEEKKDEKKDDDKEKEAAAKAAAAEAEFAEKRAAHTKVAEADIMGRIMAHSFMDEMSKIAEKNEMPFPPKKDGDDKDKDKDKKKDDKDDGKKEASSSEEKAAALVAKLQQKTASIASVSSSSSMSNFDELACYRAIDMLKEAGVDAELAFNKVNAVHVLGLAESEKVASVPDVQTGLDIRALEICEAAGFQVNWA